MGGRGLSGQDLGLGTDGLGIADQTQGTDEAAFGQGLIALEDAQGVVPPGGGLLIPAFVDKGAVIDGRGPRLPAGGLQQGQGRQFRFQHGDAFAVQEGVAAL